MNNLRVILSGGGTGGHIYPAIAIADALKKKMPDSELLFVGALGRMEMEKVPAAGYRIEGIPIAGLQRRLSLSNLRLPFLILMSFMKARRILRQFKPDVVVGTGGYASGPLLRMASLMSIPSLIQEQNSYAGITNRLLSRKAKKICVAYDGMEKFFPSEKIILTGNPVRSDLKDLEGKRNEAFDFFGLDPSLKTILVIGGSLGARTINNVVGQALSRIDEKGVQLIWQTGRLYFDNAKKKVAAAGSKYISAYDFISRMDYAYAAADIVISRAGAASVSELCNTGKAAILVPSPNVAEDHQTKNAMSLVKKEAAIIVRDTEAEKVLFDKAFTLLENDTLRRQLSANISGLARPGAADTIAAEVIKLIHDP